MYKNQEMNDEWIIEKSGFLKYYLIHLLLFGKKISPLLRHIMKLKRNHEPANERLNDPSELFERAESEEQFH